MLIMVMFHIQHLTHTGGNQTYDNKAWLFSSSSSSSMRLIINEQKKTNKPEVADLKPWQHAPLSYHESCFLTQHFHGDGGAELAITSALLLCWKLQVFSLTIMKICNACMFISTGI